MTSDDLAKLLTRPGYAVVAESKPGAKPVLPAPIAALVPTTHGKRLRQQTGQKMNKLEAAFYAYLCAARPAGQVFSQAITFKLGNGVRFTPDFMVMADATNEHENPVTELIAYETKGFMRDDAAVKIKVAAALYPQIRFHLVTKRRKAQGGGWAIEEVLP